MRQLWTIDNEGKSLLFEHRLSTSCQSRYLNGGSWFKLAGPSVVWRCWIGGKHTFITVYEGSPSSTARMPMLLQPYLCRADASRKVELSFKCHGCHLGRSETKLRRSGPELRRPQFTVVYSSLKHDINGLNCCPFFCLESCVSVQSKSWIHYFFYHLRIWKVDLSTTNSRPGQWLYSVS